MVAAVVVQPDPFAFGGGDMQPVNSRTFVSLAVPVTALAADAGDAVPLYLNVTFPVPPADQHVGEATAPQLGELMPKAAVQRIRLPKV